MKAHKYRDAVAKHIAERYKDDGLEVYAEIKLGTSIVGKDRTVDVLILDPETDDSFALECKVQMVSGTAEEKLFYALEDIEAMPIAGALVYYGEGFTKAFLHMLAASRYAVYCKPVADEDGPADTSELDTLLDIHFGFLHRRTPANKKINP